MDRISILDDDDPNEVELWEDDSFRTVSASLARQVDESHSRGFYEELSLNIDARIAEMESHDIRNMLDPETVVDEVYDQESPLLDTSDWFEDDER